ncbi:MAG: alpha/beta hydrolase [Aggregatilineales bacterium]
MNKRVLIGILLIALSEGPWLWTSAKQTQQCETELGRIVPTVVPSGVYGRPVAVNVYLPPCFAADQLSLYPVIYLLHGGAADETQWPDLNVQLSADALIGHGASPFVVIMPGAAYYDGIDYGRFVIKELLPYIESLYRVTTFRSGRAIGGLSLGGYWALKIAFLHSDLFAAVGGYSSLVNRGYPDDPLSLARHANLQTLQGLSIALDVGNQDSLAYDTNELAQALRARGLTVSLTIGRGGHQRAYWRAHTYDYFSFFLDTITRPTMPSTTTKVMRERPGQNVG